jgi:CspA family cold shock protein
VPSGKVKWYDTDKGFGFITGDDGEDVFLPSAALPAGVTAVKGGQRLEFGVAQGKRGMQALSVRVIDAPPSMAKAARKSPEDMTVIIEDLIKLLDGISNGLRRGRYPEKTAGKKIASVLRVVADDLEG